jgi:L-fuconolactonase
MRELSRRTFLQGTALLPFQRSAYRIIDPHVHVWKHDPKYPFAEGAHVPDRDATPEMLLDLMKANGVSKTVIIQVIHYKYDNRYLADVLERYLGTFQGVCRVDPLSPDAPDHLSQLVEQGFRGIRLSPGRRSWRLVSRPVDAAVVEALLGSESSLDRTGTHHAYA